MAASQMGAVAGAPFSALSEEQIASIRVLVVDDDASLRDTCESVLRMQGFDAMSVGRGEKAREAIRSRHFDILLLDLYMTEVPGMTLLEEALSRRPETVVVMMTGNPSVESNLRALEAGAWDYLPKPFSATHLDVMLGRAAHAVMHQRESVERGEDGDDLVLRTPSGRDQLVVAGRSPAFRAAIEMARKVARSNASVFITGESGAGKELIAQYIHQNSRRSKKPIVAINCAALPEPLLESEMFGHRQGAFTGAERDKPGLFETANGGTLFLDELTEMSQQTQAKLLRVIQDGVVRRVGSNTVDAVVDVRFIVATNRDPEEAVEEGHLRSDLYYRLRVVPLHVPPLRERPEDIEELANHFLQRYWTRDYPRQKAPTFTDEAVAALRSHPWPGNVRELQNVIEHTVVLSEPGAAIQPDGIPLVDGAGAANGGRGGALAEFDTTAEYHEAREKVIAEFERRYVTDVVNRAAGNMSKAARMAGVDRTTLYRLIEKHDLERDTILRSR